MFCDEADEAREPKTLYLCRSFLRGDAGVHRQLRHIVSTGRASLRRRGAELFRCEHLSVGGSRG